MKKRVLAMVMTLAMALSLLPVPVGAAETDPGTGEEVFQETPASAESSARASGNIIASGTCGAEGDNVTWELDDSGTLTISGEGEMENFRTMEGDVPWDAYKQRIFSVNIQDGVSNVGNSVFWGCQNLISVNLSDSITSIGESAFDGCTRLTNIENVNNNITEIGAWAFAHSNITEFSIPEGVTSIESSVFWDCGNLKTIIIPDSITEISYYDAFYACTSLTDIYFGGDEITWNRIYQGSDLENVTIHYNSTGPDDTDEDEQNSHYLIDILTSYDIYTKNAVFGTEETLNIYRVTEFTSPSAEEEIKALVGKPVLVHYLPPDSEWDYLYEIISMEPLEAVSGWTSEYDTDQVTINGTAYPISQEFGTSELPASLTPGIPYYAYLYGGSVVKLAEIEPEYGTLSAGNMDTATINGMNYTLNLEDEIPPYLPSPELWFGHRVQFWAVDNVLYRIELPDYNTAIYKRLDSIEGNTARFYDGSVFQFMNSSSIDTSLIGKWVVGTLVTSADGGTMLSSMREFHPEISAEIEMVDERNIRLYDNEYSYDGRDYEQSSDFEIRYRVVIESKVPQIPESDLAAMQADSSMTLTLENLEITPPDGFNSNGEIPNVPGTTILPGQTKAGEGFVRPGRWYSVDKEEVSVTETIQMKLQTSAGEYEDEVSFTIMNLDYEPPKTKEEALNSREVKDLIEKAADELGALDIDYGISITDLDVAKNYFGLDEGSLLQLKKSLLTEVIMSSAPEDSLSEQISDEMMSEVFGEYKSPVSGKNYTVPLRYIIETPDYGRLIVQFDCNITSFTLSGSEYALYATVNYQVLQQDKDSGDKTWPSYKKSGEFAQIAFADVKAYTEAAYEVAKEALEDAYDDVWGNQANQIADFLFGDVVKAILEENDTSFSKEMWKIMTWPAENMSIACPVDIFIYDETGNLCGSIENNRVTKTSTEFDLSVNGDTKYITGLRDEYQVTYKATGNGTMDIAITE